MEESKSFYEQKHHSQVAMWDGASEEAIRGVLQEKLFLKISQ